MALSEYEGLWTEIVVKLRACIENIEGKGVDDLFDHIAGAEITVPDGTPGCEADTITAIELQTFMTNNGCEVEIEKLEKLFGRGQTQPESGTPAIEDGAEEVVSLKELADQKDEKKDDAQAGEDK